MGINGGLICEIYLRYPKPSKTFLGYHSQFSLDGTQSHSSTAAYMYDQGAMTFGGTPASYLPHQSYLNAAAQSSASYGMLGADPFGTGRPLNQNDPLLTSVAMMSSAVNPATTSTNGNTESATEKSESATEKSAYKFKLKHKEFLGQ
jgi:hypothetical protein